MPAKSKKDKRKKKGRLTNEEILKLIKKLKPKNQQTVRINIGDKEDKKKGAVSNQPPVRSEVSYFHAPPKTEYFQPPQQPLPIHKPAPSLAETKATFQAPRQPEKQEVFVPRRIKERAKTRIELGPEEYTYETPSPLKASFQEPSRFKQSVLGEYASRAMRFYNPVENDPYQPELIQTTQSQDQIGNRSSFNMSSDQWTLTPEGDVQSVEDIQKAKQQEPPVEASPTEEELIQQQADLLIEESAKEATRREAFKKVPKLYSSSSSSENPSSKAYGESAMINILVREGKIDLGEFNLSPNAIYKTGRKKGEIRGSISNREMDPIYNAVIERGLLPKRVLPPIRTEEA